MEYSLSALQIGLALGIILLVILLLVGGLLFLYFSTSKSKNTIIELKEEALDEVKQQNSVLRANAVKIEDKVADLQREKEAYQSKAAELQLREAQLRSQREALAARSMNTP